MNAIRLFAEELKSLVRKKSVMISVVAAILVPLVFVGILLASKVGPYDHMDNLPVAVVNNDAGAESFGEALNAGDDLVTNLKNNQQLAWDFVTEEEAYDGLEDMTYYMIIEIPENFSENVTTVLDASPQKPELNFVQNEGLHYMAGQVTNGAVETIHAQLSTQVTETYVSNVFSQLGEVSNGFEEAADGSEQLYEGSAELKDGTTEILDSLTGKSDDIEELADGANELEDGTSEILDNLTSRQGDINRLAEGARELNSGTGEILENLRGNSDSVSELAEGARELNDGTGLLLSTLQDQSGDIEELADGAQELEAGSEELKAGAEDVSEGLDSAKSGSEELVDGLNNEISPGIIELADGVNTALDSLEPLLGLLEGIPEELLPEDFDSEDLDKLEDLRAGANDLKAALEPGSNFYDGLNNLDNGLDDLVDGQSQLQAGVNDLNEGAKQVADGNESVYGGWNELEENVAVLHDGTTQLADGNATIESGWNELTAGASELHAGASEINTGNQTVNEGWQELSAGASQLHTGAEQISDGNETVETGWSDLTDGVTQVDGGINELQSGSNELVSGLTDGVESTSQLNTGDDNMTMFASPVVLDGEVVNGFEYYRDSNVPYIMSLALFAGIIAMSFIVNFRKPAVMPASGASWFLGKVMTLSVFAVLQAVIISVFALFVLRLQIESGWMFVLFSIGVSLTFLMIVLFLVALAGNIGRFIALAFLIMQIPLTGRDLPIEMLPEIYRHVSSFLPFTYSLEGYTSIASLGNLSNAWANAGVLFIFFAVFAILGFLVYMVKFRGGMSENETLETKEEPG